MAEAVKDRIWIIDDVAVILVGLLSLGYCVFLNWFIKLKISLPGLSFPIFISEIVLFICLLLFLLKWQITHKKINFFYSVVIVYSVFVLTKALCGYSKWGPLALRHAALFYYPLFAVFGYSFFRRDFFSRNKNISLVIVFFLFLLLNISSFYDVFTCIVLIGILVSTFPNKILKYLIFGSLLVIAPFKLLVIRCRTALVSNTASTLFLLIASYALLNIKRMYHVIIAILFIALLFFGVVKLGDRNAVKTLIDLSKTISEYNSYNNLIREKKNTFKIPQLNEIKVYNEEPDNNELAKAEARGLAETPKTDFKEDENMRDFEQALGNSLYRIFIWKDLLADIYREKPLFGFDFGKPFRSRNLEMLYGARGTWTRDGWVGAHNSYLEVIYRSGLIGIMLISSLFMFLFNMIKKSVYVKPFNGLLLCSILINRLVAANFILFFELPYYAIPFWFLFGLTYAYLFKNKTAQVI